MDAKELIARRVALEIMARAPERVTRLALLDTGFEMLAAGEAGERERTGRYRLLDIARGEGMLAMGRDWAQEHKAQRRTIGEFREKLWAELMKQLSKVVISHWTSAFRPPPQRRRSSCLTAACHWYPSLQHHQAL